MTTISTIQSRVRTAVDQLLKADRANPKTEFSASELSANPLRSPPGDNGKVDKQEASTVASKFAASVYEAAGMKAGQKYLEGGGPGGFKEKIMAPHDLPASDLRLFASHVNAIATKLETDANGDVTQKALDGLPQTIKAYFEQEMRNIDRPPQITIDRMAQLVREAATGGVDWF